MIWRAFLKSFTQADFQMTFAASFILSVAEKFFILSKTQFKVIMHDHLVLGAHMHIVVFKPKTITRYIWSHLRIQLFSNDIPVQCPRCKSLKAWKPTATPDGKIKHSCSGNECKSFVEYSMPSHASWVTGARLSHGDGGHWMVQANQAGVSDGRLGDESSRLHCIAYYLIHQQLMPDCTATCTTLQLSNILVAVLKTQLSSDRQGQCPNPMVLEEKVAIVQLELSDLNGVRSAAGCGWFRVNEESVGYGEFQHVSLYQKNMATIGNYIYIRNTTTYYFEILLIGDNIQNLNLLFNTFSKIKGHK
ncbi:hypothetical protein BDZ97DRAFT_1766290 [Flammula alnicola]|nr:hypothetical protein BDZ97DRAFT_1766290 [Flammula alnicola]